MVEIYGKNYYIDIDGVTERCRTERAINDTEEGDALEINIFKYELIKMCLERVLDDYEDVDESMGMFGSNNAKVAFKIAFNTLIKNEILIEDDE
jgi:hypothetical protein